jgi:hypothetical protein
MKAANPSKHQQQKPMPHTANPPNSNNITCQKESVTTTKQRSQFSKGTKNVRRKDKYVYEGKRCTNMRVGSETQ